MKSTKEYLDDYFEMQKDLLRKGELNQLCVTQEEFLERVERIRAWGVEERKSNYLTEFYIQRSEERMFSILLMDKVEKNEYERRNIDREKYLRNEAPEIQKQIKEIQTPLTFEDIVFIYKALWRKQITTEMLSNSTFEEFKATDHYKRILQRNHEEESLKLNNLI